MRWRYRADDWCGVVREDKNLELVRLPFTLPRIFLGRWTLKSGQKISAERWKDARILAWRCQQLNEPVRLRRNGRKSLWWFRDRFWWDADRRSADDVKALALQRLGREDRMLKSAHALMKGAVNGRSGRAPIPPEVVRAVVERDGRRCVQCGSVEDLQFDHILPVSLGGATSVQNLQILCGECNRAKSDAL
jgi:HNH endonuclease